MESGVQQKCVRQSFYSCHRSSVGTRLARLWRCVCMKTLERQLRHSTQSVGTMNNDKHSADYAIANPPYEFKQLNALNSINPYWKSS